MTVAPVQVAAFTRYGTDPIGFVEQGLGEQLSELQQDIARSVQQNSITNRDLDLRVGKTFLCARLAVWWVLACKGMAITIAPTNQQLEWMLWGEIRRVLNKLEIDCDRDRTYFRISDLAYAFSFAASNNPDRIQGICADRLLIIEDEAWIMPQVIEDIVQATVTGPDNRLLRIGTSPMRKQKLLEQRMMEADNADATGS